MPGRGSACVRAAIGRGDRAFEQAAWTSGRDRTQRLCIGGIPQRVAGLHRCAVGPRVERACIRQASLRDFTADVAGEALGYGEALVRGARGGVEEVAPGQAAEPLVRESEHGDCARRAGRAAAGDCVGEGERLAVVADEHVGSRARGRGFASLEGHHPAGLPVQDNEECAAAEPRALRLHQPKRRLHRDRGVHRASALAQHREARFDRQGIRGADTRPRPHLRRVDATGRRRARVAAGGHLLAGDQRERSGQYEACGESCRSGHRSGLGPGQER